MGERIDFSINGAGTTVYPLANEWSRTLASHYIQRWTWDGSNVRAETLKLLEGNIGVNLCDLAFGNDFLDLIPKAQLTKEKIEKLDFIKIKNICDSKNTIEKLKTQAT